MPKLSVLIPIYGVEKYIEKCVRSLFEQTLDDIEFVFVDDCTPDKSIDILQRLVIEYATQLEKTNKQIRIEKMPKNGGLAAVRKYGLQFCTGDYIVHCDSDDWLDVHMYERLYACANNNKYDLVFCDYIISTGDIKSEKTFEKAIVDTSQSSLIKRLLTSSDLNPVWSVFAKRSLYNNIVPAKGDMSEDNVLVVQLVCNAKNIFYLNDPLYYYRLTPGSIVRKNDEVSIMKKFNQVRENRKIINDFLDKLGIRNDFKRELIAYLYDVKMRIIPLLDQKKYYLIWKNTYSDINNKILYNPCISLKNKVLYILLHIALFRKIYCKKIKAI